MTPVRAVLMSALLCAPTLSSAGVDEARLQELVGIICDNGGSMHTSEAAQVLPASGFAMDETQAIVAELERRKLVAKTQGIAVLKLKNKACR